MSRALYSSLLSLLLLVTLVWGGCVSCEKYFMFGGAKSCCSADGRCKTKPVPSRSGNAECKQIAFEQQKAVDFHVDLTVTFVVKRELPIRIVEAQEHWRVHRFIEPSPPDLLIRDSIFLI